MPNSRSCWTVISRTLLPLVPLCSVIGSAPWIARAVTGPDLTLTCGMPNHPGIVHCRLYGSHFYPDERVRVRYTVIFINEPKQSNGHYPSEVIRREARTGKHGHFARPPMWFQTHPKDGSFRVRAAVRGATQDHAEVDFWGVMG